MSFLKYTERNTSQNLLICLKVLETIKHKMNKSINKIIKSPKQEIMPGRSINAPLPNDALSTEQTSPFILLHHFGPMEINYLNKFEFEPHPHRGFDAVTILFDGRMQHRDSTGGKGSLSAGDVQWMTAGSGILHEESQPDEFLKKGGIIHGIQLWVNIPKEHKMAPPKYQDISSGKIPLIGTEGVSSERVIAGEYKGITGPASTFSPVTAVLGKLLNGKDITCEIPENHNSLIYITLGKLNISGNNVNAGDLVSLSRQGKEILIRAEEDSEYLLLSGKPIDEPVVQYGPFVMNTMGEIKQAFIDYREGRFGNPEVFAK
jgi:redox-sensitive bicupin YhaK (pirin superfamily)